MHPRNNLLWTLGSLVGVAAAVWLAREPNPSTHEARSPVGSELAPEAALPLAAPRLRHRSLERVPTGDHDNSFESTNAVDTHRDAPDAKTVDSSQRDGSRRLPRWAVTVRSGEIPRAGSKALAPKERIAALAARLREQPSSSAAQQQVAQRLAMYLDSP